MSQWILAHRVPSERLNGVPRLPRVAHWSGMRHIGIPGLCPYHFEEGFGTSSNQLGDTVLEGDVQLFPRQGAGRHSGQTVLRRLESDLRGLIPGF